MTTFLTDEIATERPGIATVPGTDFSEYLSGFERIPLTSAPASPSAIRKWRFGAFVVEWRELGGAPPTWFEPLMRGFAEVLSLSPNWNSYGARPIDRVLVNRAIDAVFLYGILGPSMRSPQVVPLASGGVELAWRRDAEELEIVFDQDEPDGFYYFNRNSGEEIEQPLAQARERLRELVQSVAS